MNFENPKSNTYLCSHSGILYIYYNKEIFMPYPSYNSVEELTAISGSHSGDINLRPNGDGLTGVAGNTGRWKGFMHTNADGFTANVSLFTFNGEGLTFEGVAANSVIPVAFNRTNATGCTSASASFKLWGLN